VALWKADEDPLLLFGGDMFIEEYVVQEVRQFGLNSFTVCDIEFSADSVYPGRLTPCPCA